MEKRNVRLVAINLAFMQLFAQQIMAYRKARGTSYHFSTKQAEKTDMEIPKARGNEIILVDNSNKDNPVYQIKDKDTGEMCVVSIFDTDNIQTNQYGASQTDFIKRFKEIMKEPLIWEEVQKYFPVSDFTDEEEAMFFYEKYFEQIGECGCGYAAAADSIFRIFEGKEEAFYKAFGYPMYTIRNNEIDFNYEIMMLQLFQFYNIDIRRDKKEIQKSVSKEFYEYQMKHLMDLKKELNRIDRNEIAKWTEEDWDKHRKLENQFEKRIAELQKKSLEAPNKKDFNFGVPLNGKFGYLDEFLRRHGVRISSSHKSGLGRAKEDEILASKGSNLYKIDEDGCISQVEENVEPHYVYISDIEEDGDIIVSSWGAMYLIDLDHATQIDKILIKQPK